MKTDASIQKMKDRTYFQQALMHRMQAATKSQKHLAQSTAIPVIDLSTSTSEELLAALESTGFFYLKQNVISRNEMKSILEASQKFFELPTDKKRPLYDPEMNRGYTCLGDETLDLTIQKKGDTKEGFYLGRDVPAEFANKDKFAGPNIYPGKELGLDGWKEMMDGYMAKAHQVCMQLLKMIAKALRLPVDYFDEFFTEPMSLLRLLQYSHEPSNLQKGVMACGAHSDYGCLTLLLTNEVPGLQIQFGDKWIDVPPIYPEGFIVNIGDMLERWSNGKFKSTVHRVLTKPGASNQQKRLSVPFFFEPNYDTLVKCLPGTGKPKFATITQGDYLKMKLAATHIDFGKFVKQKNEEPLAGKAMCVLGDQEDDGNHWLWHK